MGPLGYGRPAVLLMRRSVSWTACMSTTLLSATELVSKKHEQHEHKFMQSEMIVKHVMQQAGGNQGVTANLMFNVSCIAWRDRLITSTWSPR